MRVAVVLGRVGVSMALALLSSCSDAPSSGSGQVVARVGDTELTAAQFDARLRRLPPGTDRRDPEVLRVVLGSFIDEVLLAKAAEKDKLDKRPAVARDIETARNVVLASEYIDHNVPSKPVNETMIRRYYNDNPALFANRRIYRLTDLAVLETQPGAPAVIAEMGRPGATAASVTAVARAGNVVIETASGLQSGDALPTKLALGLANMGVGDNVNYRVARTRHFTHVDDINESPITFAAAHDTIGDQLIGQARRIAVEARLAKLRAETKIEYGEVGKGINAGTAASLAKNAPRSAGSTSRNQAIERGATGL